MKQKIGMNSELVFGLIAPLGASLDGSEQQLHNVLKAFGYRVTTIHVSSIIEELYQHHYSDKRRKSPFGAQMGNLERIRLLQDGGDALRIDAQRGDILALSAMRQIAHLRKKDSCGPCAYIIRSLKHPGELSLLREIYEDRFYAISAFSSRQRRIANLKKGVECDEKKEIEAQLLVDRDYRRGCQEASEDRLDSVFSQHWFDDKRADRTSSELREYGQQLQGTFYQADLFVDTSDDQLMQRHIKRFVQLIFGHPFLTPTKEEFAMFQAKSVSLRSADLSRQVGAVIATKSGDIIAGGTNEVPKCGGGLHWASSDLNEDPESRDFHFFADEELDTLRLKKLTNVLHQLCQKGWQFSNINRQEKPNEASIILCLARQLRKLHISQMGDFGRTVHAEMAALMDAVSRGVCVSDHIMYVTLFPCHQCAKHLIAAGIKRVVFIEPYPKSETVELWPSEVANFEIDESAEDGRMQLIPFVGIAPHRYIDFFQFDPQKRPRRIDRDGKRRVALWQVQRQMAKNSTLNIKATDCSDREQALLQIYNKWFKDD